MLESAAQAAVTVAFRPTFCVVALVFYAFLSKPLVAALRDATGLEPTSSALKLFVFLHNLALAIFSGGFFFCVFPAFYAFLGQQGWVALHCNSELWGSFLGYWAKIFYVSKFWEFIDTWILVLKGKEPSFLQLYHHIGIAIAMYLGCVYECNWLIWPCVLNSFIHTLMYTYYALATCGFKSKWAKLLTKMQLGQFVMGIAFSSSSYFFQGCLNVGQASSMVFIQIYAVGLIYLFYQMYKSKYKKKKTTSDKAQ